MLPTHQTQPCSVSAQGAEKRKISFLLLLVGILIFPAIWGSGCSSSDQNPVTQVPDIQAQAPEFTAEEPEFTAEEQEEIDRFCADFEGRFSDRDIRIKDMTPNSGDILDHALASAVMKCDVAVVKYLVFKGADVNAIGVLPAASHNKNLEVAKFLVSKGADVKKTSDGFTALHQGAHDGNLEFIKFLVSEGADVNAKTVHDKTPLDFAYLYGNEAVIEYLVSVGAEGKNEWNLVRIGAEDKSE